MLSRRAFSSRPSPARIDSSLSSSARSRSVHVAERSQLPSLIVVLFDLLSLRVDSAASCGDVQRRAQAKLARVEAKLKDLESMAGVLKDLIKSCRAGQPTDRCPILKSLEEKRRSDDGNRKAKR